jgi:16S rRNA (adenine1518-N6/adenine1519-N6)-dimethyltransferase
MDRHGKNGKDRNDGKDRKDRKHRKKRQGPSARKRFGQHFLESVWVGKLIDLINPQPDDIVLEIGPGRGALTLPLAARAGRVVAVEIDRDLAAEIRPRLPANALLLCADVLAVDLKALFEREIPGSTRLRVVGNLPYNVAAPILFRLLAFQRSLGHLTDATITLQQEVADRLLAEPGTGEYGVLTILVRMQADVTRLLTLPPGAFRPAPAITSTVVRMTFRSPLIMLRDLPGFEVLVKGIFTRRRKTILNALKPMAEAAGASASDALAAVGIDSVRRPETLEVAELAALADFLAAVRK